MYKYGEIKCEAILQSGKNQGLRCTNGAYYHTGNGYLCGMHSKNIERKELEKMSGDQKEEIKKIAFDIMFQKATKIAEQNIKDGKVGTVKLVKLNGRFSKVTPEDGWLDIYPNYMSTYQGIGLVYPSLSPMSIGPIKHGQKDLPDALNLENFYQYSKFYEELESKEDFKALQIKCFLDKKPNRRKYDKKDIPTGFIWHDQTKEHCLNYLESRQFYANFYQRGIESSKDFLALKKLLQEGYKLRICGPDAYELKETSMASYIDTSVPRGHEYCLYEMLMNQKGNYPWVLLKTFDF
jgi:hypothetical protein